VVPRRSIIDPAPAKPVVMPWEDFQEFFTKAHRQGEHCSFVGPTGGGKSTLGLEICKMVGAKTGRDGRPSRVTILATKTRDATLQKMTKQGWTVIKKWPPKFGEEHAIVWPRGGKDVEQKAQQQRIIFRPLLGAIFQEGGQAVYIDEAAYFERATPNGLGLSGTLEQIWTEARSNKLTLIAGTQRPVRVSRSMWSEPSWVFIITPEDEDDLKRVAQLSGRKREVLEIVPQLGGYEFLCVQRQRNGQRALIVSKVNLKAKATLAHA
jgi:hypothetical protein